MAYDIQSNLCKFLKNINYFKKLSGIIMTIKELYELAKSHNLEDTPLYYPEYGDEDLLKEAKDTKIVVNFERSIIILK